MSTPLRIGIIGCGKIADVSHIPGYLEAGAAIVALADPEQSRADGLNDKHKLGATVYTDYRVMLAEANLDAVSICTPNFLHCPMTLAAVDAGLHVLCEKPIAGNLEDATHMVLAAEAAGKVLQINQSLRYIPDYATLASLVADGLIGDVIHVRCIRAGGSSPDKGWSPGAEWFVSAKAQGGLLLDIGIHMADAMAWIAGPVTRISGDIRTRTPGIDVPDNVSAIMHFASGATGNLTLSWTIPCGAGYLEVYGSKGTLRLGFGKGIEHLAPGKEPVTLEPSVKPPSSYATFVAAIQSGTPSASDGRLGWDALALCSAIAASSASGRTEAVQHLA